MLNKKHIELKYSRFHLKIYIYAYNVSSVSQKIWFSSSTKGQDYELIMIHWVYTVS